MKEPIFIIQECQKENSFDKEAFVASISQMSGGDFDSFCRKVKDLTHYYHSTRGASVSDDLPFIEANHDKFWKLTDIK